MSRRGRRRSGCGWKLWVVFWAAVGGVELWDLNRDKLPTPLPRAEVHFVALQHPTLIEDPANDGDSFKVAHGSTIQVLRLYFVDCPEKRQYTLVEGRLKDQASYFGGLTIPQTLQIGAQAKAFTEKLLREQPFTVHTRWTRVYNSQRVYALIFFADGEELSEKLVRAGLCRIHTKGTQMPNGRSEYDFEKHLRLLEQEAKTARRGAWGLTPPPRDR